MQATGHDKDQLVTSLSALLCFDAGVDASADNLSAVLSASGNTTPDYYPTIFASIIEKAGGVDKFLKIGGGGGGGGGAVGGGSAPAAGGGAPAAVAKEEKPKEEEVDALEGGMDMFGGGGGGGGGDY